MNERLITTKSANVLGNEVSGFNKRSSSPRILCLSHVSPLEVIGGTGIAPLEFADHLGMPREGLTFVHDALATSTPAIALISGASGQIISAFNIARRFQNLQTGDLPVRHDLRPVCSRFATASDRLDTRRVGITLSLPYCPLASL